MKRSLLAVAFGLLSAAICFAGDSVPSGFLPMSKLAEAQAKAKQTKKFVAITVHGFDDQCPYTADAFSKGTTALRSSCVMVYVRVKDLRASESSLPAALKTPAQTTADGANVAFYVYDPDMGKLITSVDRGKIQHDPQILTETKKQISEARKQTAGSSATSGLDELDALKKHTSP